MNTQQFPTLEQLNAELKRSRYSRRYNAALKGTVLILVIIAVAAIAASFLFLSVMKVQGSSMSPTLQSGDIVVALKGTKPEKGDLSAFYFNDKLLVKRVIAEAGDEVSILPNGTVSVNGATLSENYVSAKTLGDCDITFPYVVPQDRLFVLGDERSVSLDSRHTAIGCVAPEQVVGRVVLRIWPLNQLKFFKAD